MDGLEFGYCRLCVIYAGEYVPEDECVVAAVRGAISFSF